MLIKTTGLEDYSPGGTARVKVLVIGGPGTGKSRWSSYFPKPFYADCEGGLASVADRHVPYVTINSSQDMLDALAHMKQECQQPVANRTYDTFIVDTLDAFQRKVKNEWLEINKKQIFTGYEAWGYMTSKVQMLMTRLLNLDMNIVVLVHYKDKVTKDDESGKETHTLQPQLQGELVDTVFNDFDLVAWMGTYWQAVAGERLQKRGLKFKPTPEMPFLKDRLHVVPDWLEVAFADTDYTNLFDAIQTRAAGIGEGAVVGEIAATAPDTPTSGFVITPGALGTGPLPATTARDLPLSAMDRPTLLKQARDAGVTTTVDGTPIKGNTLKAELLAALEAHASNPPPISADPPPVLTVEIGTPEAVADQPAAVDLPAQVLARVANLTTSTATVVDVPEGRVDTSTGELLDQHQAAIAVAKETLGAVVIDDPGPTISPPEPAPVVAAAPVPEQVCEACGKPLAGENPDFVKLSWIKFRKKYCEKDYIAAKNAKR